MGVSGAALWAFCGVKLRTVSVTGMVTVNTDPLLSALAQVIWPPCSFIYVLIKSSPMPEPATFAFMALSAR